MHEYPAVPHHVVDPRGAPRFGTYRGELPSVDLAPLSGPFKPARWQWRFRRKRWQYSLLVTDELLCCQAVVDGSYFANGFIYAVDLYEEKPILVHSTIAVPGLQVQVNDHPSLEHLASLRAPGLRMETRRDETSAASFAWKTEIAPARALLPRGLNLDLRAYVESAGPALTVIAPVDQGMVNITQKWAGLPSDGFARIGSRTYALHHGLTGFDYTQGILARRTSWRWAMALGRLSDGRRVGLNLVAGFNDDVEDANENALWIDGVLTPLGRASFTLDRDRPDWPWQVHTDDGRVSLRLFPYYVHREMRNLGVIKSFFLQPAGRLEGILRLDDHDHFVLLHGVMEDQDVQW